MGLGNFAIFAMFLFLWLTDLKIRVDVDHSGSLDFPEFLRCTESQTHLHLLQSQCFLSLMNGMMTGWDPNTDLRYM